MYYYFDIFGMPIMIGIEGIKTAWDACLIILCIVSILSFPITIGWMIYSGDREYKQFLLQSQSQHISQPGDQIWDPLTEFPREQGSLYLSLQPSFLHRAMGIIPARSFLKALLSLALLSILQ